MKKVFIGLLSLALVACAAGGKPMTQNRYFSVPLGLTEKELVQKFGSPATIDEITDGKIYQYVEKVMIGNRVVEERMFDFTIKNGKVIRKTTQTKVSNPYQNSYDMQTSLPEVEKDKTSQ
jgi:outer membrane protein assembly factor BamE (lipoprotein component of BamABCDE complex)